MSTLPGTFRALGGLPSAGRPPRVTLNPLTPPLAFGINPVGLGVALKL